jgi:hypothetical protein
LAPPDGSVYPPAAIASAQTRSVSLDATLPGDRALIIAAPYVPWMAPPQIEVTANGIARAPLARDVAAMVFACGECAGSAGVAWRLSINSSAPERVDVVTIAPRRE